MSKDTAAPGRLVLLGGLATLLAVLTGFSFIVSELVLVAPAADVSLRTFVTLAGAALAGASWLRFRESRRPWLLLETAAFLALAAGSSILLLLSLSSPDPDPAAPSSAPLYIWVLQNLLVGLLLLTGAIAERRSLSSRQLAGRRWASELVLVAPSIALVCAAALLLVVDDALPVLHDTSRAGAGMPPLSVQGASAALLISQTLIAALFVAASFNYARLTAPSLGLHPYPAYASAGLFIGGLSQLYSVLMPGGRAGLISGADVLFAAFLGVVLAGVAASLWRHLTALRAANSALAELEGAAQRLLALEGRARLARTADTDVLSEIRRARRTHARLTQVLLEQSHAGSAVQETAARVAATLSNAMWEARLAVVSLEAEEDGTTLWGEVALSGAGWQASRLGSNPAPRARPLNLADGQVRSDTAPGG